MKIREAWDQVYLEHGENVPWAVEPELNNWYIEILSRYLPKNQKGKSLLDYGCGFGQVAEHFRSIGCHIELADLSEVLTKKLIEKYQNKVPVYLVTTPDDISKNNAYDVILAIGVFHHLDPDNWTSFLDGFHNLLKKDGILFIAGWDKSDEEISHVKESLFTHLSRWFINDLCKYINYNKYSILADSSAQIRYKSLSFLRTMHYFVLKKK